MRSSSLILTIIATTFMGCDSFETYDGNAFQEPVVLSKVAPESGTEAQTLLPQISSVEVTNDVMPESGLLNCRITHLNINYEGDVTSEDFGYKFYLSDNLEYTRPISEHSQNHDSFIQLGLISGYPYQGEVVLFNEQGDESAPFAVEFTVPNCDGSAPDGTAHIYTEFYLVTFADWADRLHSAGYE